MLDEDWAYIAEKDGEVVGAALTLPDINQVMAKLNGRLLPFGWLALPARQGQDRPRCASSRSASSTTTSHTGVAAGLYLKHLETAARPGAIEGGEMGWILETNEPMNRAMEGMGGKVVKSYRIYEKRAWAAGFRSCRAPQPRESPRCDGCVRSLDGDRIATVGAVSELELEPVRGPRPAA